MSSYNPAYFVDRDRKIRGFNKMLRPEISQSIMLIEAPEHLGKSWLIKKLCDECHQGGREISVVEVDFTNAREKLEVRDPLGFIRLLKKKLDRPDYFSSLNSVINRFTETDIREDFSVENTLAPKIVDAFKLNDLKILSQYLNINFEDLEGTTITLKSRELVSYFVRRGELPILMERLMEDRSNVDWWQGLEEYRDSVVVLKDEGDERQRTIIADLNAPLRIDNVRARRLAELQITDAFFECLGRLADEQGPLVFLFDGFEDAPQESREWIQDWLENHQTDQIISIFTGQDTGWLSRLKIDENLVVATDLDTWQDKPQHVEEFFRKRNIPIPPDEIPLIIKWSGGKPGKLALIAEEQDNPVSKDDAFFDD